MTLHVKTYFNGVDWGIAFMGIDIPLIMQYGWLGKVLLVMGFIFYIFKRNIFLNRPILKPFTV